MTGLITANYAVHTVLQSFLGLVDVLGETTQLDSAHYENLNVESNDKTERDLATLDIPFAQRITVGIAMISWPAILATLSLVLAKTRDENVIQVRNLSTLK